MPKYRFKIQEKVNVNSRDRQYFSHNQRLYRVFCGDHYFIIVEITHAGRRGKICNELSFRANDKDPDSHLKILLQYLETLFEATTSEILPRELMQPEIKTQGTFYFHKVQAIKICPPDWSIIRPLEKEPKKWTIPHVVRALVNGQFEDLQRDYRYTDDYAWDNATNFGEGFIGNFNLAEEIISIDLHWTVFKDYSDRLSVQPHSNESYSFKFIMDKKNTV